MISISKAIWTRWLAICIVLACLNDYRVFKHTIRKPKLTAAQMRNVAAALIKFADQIDRITEQDENV